MDQFVELSGAERSLLVFSSGSDQRELAAVRQRVSTPIAADESVGSLRELRRAVELEACDVVNVKLAGAPTDGLANTLLVPRTINHLGSPELQAELLPKASASASPPRASAPPNPLPPWPP